MLHKIIFLIVSLVLCVNLGAGCMLPTRPRVTQTVTSTGTLEQVSLGGQWKSVSVDMDRLEYRYATTTQGYVVVYRFSPDAFHWHFEVSTSTPRSVRGWSEFLPNATVVINGLYFHEDYSPSGYLMSRGKQVGSRRFDPQKSGMIQLAPSVQLIDSRLEKKIDTTSTEAGQSYPFLVLDGKPAITKDSGLVARRSFMGIDRQGIIYLGIVPHDWVTLYRLSQITASLPVDWHNVINLDGGPSAGLSVRDSEGPELLNSDVPVPIVIVGERKR